MEMAKDQSWQIHSSSLVKHLGCGKGPDVVNNYLVKGNFTS